MAIKDITPLGLTQFYNSETNETIISFCYLENADIDHFIFEYWDEEKKKYVPFDGKHGIIEKR